MRQPFWALVKISRLIEPVTEEEVSAEFPAPLEVYLIGQLDGVGIGAGGHWSGKGVDGGPFF
jgi:hypothetical protein